MRWASELDHTTPPTAGTPAPVLFVDDEASLREVVKAYLETRYLSVVTAANGLDALRIFMESHGIRVVITDEDMPGMNGHTLIREIRRIDPSVRVIIASANIPNDLQRDEAGVVCIWKPYLPSELTNAVQQMLAA